MSRNRYEDGDIVSADQFVVNMPGLLLDVFGRGMLMLRFMVVLLSSRMLKLASYGLSVLLLWVFVKSLWPRSGLKNSSAILLLKAFTCKVIMASSLPICSMIIANSRIHLRVRWC